MLVHHNGQGNQMPYDRKKHHRRSIRLPGHDYRSPGAYFVTICTHQGKLLFGEVVDDDVVLNEDGQIAHEEWQASEDIRREIELDAFVIMPNHIHCIVWIRETDDNSVVRVHSVVGAHGRAPLRAPRSLGSFIAGYKAAVTARINHLRDTPGARVWQRNYYEHIIRNDASLNRIRAYIQHNPACWAEDSLHPGAERNPFTQPKSQARRIDPVPNPDMW
jgi:putative transposase